MKYLTLLLLIITLFILLLLYKNDKFQVSSSFRNITTTTTNPLAFLRTNITQTKLKPEQETLFTIPASASAFCKYPEQCRNPTRKTW